MTEPSYILQLQNITTQFGLNKIHEHLDLNVLKGEIIGIIGGSGSGKSVLLSTILGLNKPAAGEIIINGIKRSELTPKKEKSLCQKWGVLFQNGALFSSLTIAENIIAPLKEFTMISKKLCNQIVNTKLNLVGLPKDTAQKYPSELSGGMRKRAALARALAADPDILFLDEPTAGLDPIGAAAFDQLIKELHAALGVTVYLITHDMDSLYALCHRIAVLAEKKIYCIATIPELVKNPYPWIQEYFNGPRGRNIPAASAIRG